MRRAGAAIVLGMTLGAPGQVTDLKATMLPAATQIAWRLTIPAFNDSAPCNSRTRGLRPASDSVTYHYRVWGLPIPYVWVLEDSSRQARADTVRRAYQTWIDKYYITDHWLTRRVSLSPDDEQPEPGCLKRTLMRMR